MSIIKIKKSDIQELYKAACSDWKTKILNKYPDFIFLDILDVEESFLLEVKNACDISQLKIFNKTLSKYLPETLFSKIKSYSDICIELDEIEIEESQFDSEIFDSNEIKTFVAIGRIKQAERLFNDTWKKDWNNTNQRKWYPYFNLNSSCGLVGLICSSYCTFGCCGLVAFYKDEETSNFVGKLMWSEYKQLIG